MQSFLKNILLKNNEMDEYPQYSTRLCVCVCVCVHAQLCPTLCSPIDCSLPGFPVQGISLARILECVPISSSMRSFQLRDQTHVSYTSPALQVDSLPLSYQGSKYPQYNITCVCICTG